MAYESVRDDRRGGDASWAMHQMQSNPKGAWPAHYTNSENNNWNSTVVPGSMEAVPYHAYPGNYWYAHSHPAPYGSAYPTGSEVNGHGGYNPQTMPGFLNGAYNPGQYPAGMMHPPNPFYCGDHPPPQQGLYPGQGCADQGAATPAQPQHYPVSHCQGTPGYPTAPYPQYGDGCHPVPQNSPFPPHPHLHATGYTPAPLQPQWQPDPQATHAHYRNPILPPQPPSWTDSAPGMPPQYDIKEQPYPGFTPRNTPAGPRHRPPNATHAPTAEFSAPPQIHSRSRGKEQEVKQAQSETPAGSETPGLARVQQVLYRVHLLQEDVDEFVGYKTDKSYRCLEELLTKELLELDSVETNGQEGIRQIRKEAVQKIQAILEQLEKKAF